MNTRNPRFHFGALLVGDLFTLTLVTLFGFSTHGTITTAGARMLTTFAPLAVGWLLIAPHLGVFDRALARDWRQLWRPFWAMLLAAPLAAFLRGAWLNSAILPVFVAVLGGVSALGLLAWRGVWLWIINPKR